MLVHSRLKPLSEPSLTQSDPVLDKVKSDDDNASNRYGCYKCEKLCNVCKFYLKEGSSFSSFHTEQIFSFKENVDCKTEGIIYLINDLKCNRSSVGKSTSSITVRWRNHKSHIKKSIRSCAITLHFSDFHVLDISSFLNYDQSLSNQIEVMVIEKVNFKDEKDSIRRDDILSSREAYWQGQLRTMEVHGGFEQER